MATKMTKRERDIEEQTTGVRPVTASEAEKRDAFAQAEKTQARMVDATEEEIKNVAKGERYFREHMKKNSKR